MKKVLLVVLVLSLVAGLFAGFAGCAKKNDEGTITIRNLYFNDWNGDDAYTAALEEQFGIKIKTSTYSWADWDQQVSSAINGGNVTDVFQADIDSYNFANSYAFWADDRDIKPLPSDLSPWPNLKAMIEGISDVDELKYKAKGDKEKRLWGIPVAKNIQGGEADFTPFTYVYRRDWAKQYGVYKENDIYTWEEFNTLLQTFYNQKCRSGDFYALVDVEWGFPSIVNFYKTAPHCFAIGSNGKIVSNYASDEYVAGLTQAKNFVTSKIYGYEQYSSNEGDANKKYYGGRVGVFYENLSLSNYTTLRNKIKESNKNLSAEALDDMTAIMKVKGPDGKYALEGQLDWFSMTFFSSKISDEKMKKILDIMDYLLSEEGTMLAKYGFEDYDYTVDQNGKVTLTEAGWEKDDSGRYIDKYNGAKYLRYMCTLGYDMTATDPMTDQKAYTILNDWTTFMKDQKAAGNLRVLNEDPQVKWMNDKSVVKTKAEKSGKLLEDANAAVMQYCYGNLSLDKYKSAVNDSTWQKVLKEINDALGK